MREEMDAPMPPTDFARYQKAVAETRAASPGPGFDEAWQHGRGLAVEDAVRYAMGTDDG